MQFVDENGETQRYCQPCYQKREEERDKRRQEANKGFPIAAVAAVEETTPVGKMSLPEAVRKKDGWEIGGVRYKFAKLLNKDSNLSAAKGKKVARLPSGKFWLIGLFTECK
jgi:hypothetical protein